MGDNLVKLSVVETQKKLIFGEKKGYVIPAVTPAR
jgi:hypothetical protein